MADPGAEIDETIVLFERAHGKQVSHGLEENVNGKKVRNHARGLRPADSH